MTTFPRSTAPPRLPHIINRFIQEPSRQELSKEDDKKENTILYDYYITKKKKKDVTVPVDLNYSTAQHHSNDTAFN